MYAVVYTVMRLLFGVINGELYHRHLPYHVDCFVNVFHHMPLNYIYALCLQIACQCINHSGTKGNEWGILKITSNDNRMNGTECTVIYVRAAPGEIVELRFYDIHLRKG